MTTTQSGYGRDDIDRANPLGGYVTTVGAIITLIAVWLPWVTLGPGDSEGNSSSGYEADSVIPFIGFLGIAFAIALLYATSRADRRQHRGLSLASMAVGLASLLFCIAFLIDPIATVQYAENVSIEIGVFIAALGALIWTVGSFLLAKEPEGDVERSSTVSTTAVRETAPMRTTTQRATGQHEVSHSTDSYTSGTGHTAATGSGATSAGGSIGTGSYLDPNDDDLQRGTSSTDYR